MARTSSRTALNLFIEGDDRMAFNIDDWIPNFTLFVYVLAPLILGIIFIMIILSRWFNLRKVGEPRAKLTFADKIGLIPALYLIEPIWEIGEYLNGTRDTIFDRLFTYHFPIFMFLVLCVGIGQVGYYWISMGTAGEVRG